jgi:hypothetical protein
MRREQVIDFSLIAGVELSCEDHSMLEASDWWRRESRKLIIERVRLNKLDADES